MNRLYEIMFKLRDGVSKKLKAINRLQEHAASLASRVGRAWKSAFRKLRDEADRTYNRIASRLDDIAIYIKGAFAAATGALIGESVRLAANMEQTRVGYETLLKSQERAADLMGQLQQFADYTPFATDEVLQAGKVLLGLGVPADKIIGKMRTLGEISAGSGKDLNELAVAYGKMAGAGIVQNEDLNQLIDAGIPIMGELQKMLGKSTLEIKKMAEKGLDIGLIDQAFQNLTTSGGLYFDLMNKQSQTTAGRFSTLQSKAVAVLRQIGEALQPLVNQLIDMGMVLVDRIIPAFQAFGEFLSRNAVVIAAVVAGIVAYRAVTLGAILVTKTWAAIQALLNGVMMANPIGLVIGLIAALVAGIVVAYMKFDKFRGLMHGVWAAFKSAFGKIGELAKAVGQILLGAVTFDKALIMKGFSGFKTALGSAGKAVADSFREGYQDGINREVKLPGFLTGSTGAMAAAEPGGPAATTPVGASAGGILTGSTSASPSNAVQAGGNQRPTNINITIERFQDQVVFNTTNLDADEAEIQRWFEEMLLRVTNSVNQFSPA